MSEKTGQLHGRDHSENGIDPIPGVSDALHWGVNDDTDALGLELNAQDDLVLAVPAQNSSATLADDGSITIQTDGGATNPDMTLDARGTLLMQGQPVHIRSIDTQPFEVHNSSDAVVLRVDDDGTVHIKTGTTIVADL